MNKNNKPDQKYTFAFICNMLFVLTIIPNFYVNAQHIRGVLKGSVQDMQGKTIAGATVTLYPDQHSTQSDAEGRFLFKQIIAGQYRIEVSMLGMEPFSNMTRIYPARVTEETLILKPANEQLREVEISARQASPDNLLDAGRGAMPVTIISRQQITEMGSRRLDELLKEQTGIAIVNNIGGGARSIGVQLQGFGSEYVMILIDGQPMLGRNSGNFDLSRISVNNIERIEIIKGASSCLFGSEALGGAINIVTRHGALLPQATAALRYGSLNIADGTLEGETPFASQRGSANLSVNCYRTDGFNTDPEYLSGGVTAPPYRDISIQGRTRYRLSETATLGASGRYAARRSYMEQIYTGSSSFSSTGINDNQNINDFNFSATYDQHFNSGLRSMSRYYLTRYHSDLNISWKNSNAHSDSENFDQLLHRFEQQFAYSPVQRLKLTGGTGVGLEGMSNIGFEVPKDLWNVFAYLQSDWQIREGLELIAGLRYDRHHTFGGRYNPSIGLQYAASPKLTLKMAVGSGFKTPDYRQRYQIFMNPVANYLVIGSELLRQTLEQMKSAGEISEVRQYLVNQLDQRLDAERSVSFNGGFVYAPLTSVKLDINAFYHNISNQINSIRVATGTSVRDIFTYQNLPESFNTGLEGSVLISPGQRTELNFSYQYLVVKDKGVMDSIRRGTNAYAHVWDPRTGMDRTSALSDYWGIENRSRHMANIRISYRYPRQALNLSLRLNYRGKYAFDDLNNNRFIDPYDTFVEGHLLLNAAIEKRLMRQHLSVQLTAENIMNYTDRLMPGQPGRVVLLGIAYRFYKE